MSKRLEYLATRKGVLEYLAKRKGVAEAHFDLATVLYKAAFRHALEDFEHEEDGLAATSDLIAAAEEKGVRQLALDDAQEAYQNARGMRVWLDNDKTAIAQKEEDVT